GGQITISRTGGTGPFTYTGTFRDGSALTPNTAGVFTELDQTGEYTFTITDDSTGCTQTIKHTLHAAIQPPVPTINAFTDVSCFEAADGTITVSVLDNGIDPYTFQITDMDGNPLTTAIDPTSSTNTSAVFTALANADYTIT